MFGLPSYGASLSSPYSAPYSSPYSSAYSNAYSPSAVPSSTSTSIPANASQVEPNPNDPKQQKKLLFEEYYKMMGGLKSVLQLGLAFIALANFSTKSFQLIKKFWNFLTQTTKTVATYADEKLFGRVLEGISEAKKSPKKLKILMLLGLRLLGMIAVAVGMKIRYDLQAESSEKEKELKQKLELIEKEEELQVLGESCETAQLKESMEGNL